MRTKSPQRKTLRRNNLSEYDNYINVSNRRNQFSRNLSNRRKQNLSEYDNYVSNKQSNEINPLYFLFGDDNDEIEKLKEQIRILESKKDEECQKKLEQCNRDLAECKTNLNSINTQMQAKIKELNTKITESNIKSQAIEDLFNQINTLNQNHTVNIANLNRTSEAQRKSMGDLNAQIQSLNNQKIVLEEQNKKHIETISLLKTDIENISNEIERLKSEIKKRDENLQKLQEEITKIKSERRFIDVEKSAMIARKDKYKKALEEKEAEIKQLKEQIRNNLAKQTVTDAVNNNMNKIYITKLTSEKNELNIQLKKLSGELNSLKESDDILKSNLIAKESEIARLTSANEILKEDIETREKINKKLDDVIMNSANKENELQNLIASLKKQVEEKTNLENTRVKENKFLEVQNDKLIRELDELTKNINTVFDKFKLKFVNPDTKNEDSVTPNYKYVKSAISQLEQYINKINKNNEEVKDTLEHNVESLTKDSKEKDDEIKELKNDIDEKQTLWKDTVKDNEKLKTELLEIREQLVGAQNANVAYKEERDEEFKTLEKLHTENIHSKEIQFNKNCDEKIKQNTDSLNAKHKVDIDALRLSLESDYERAHAQLIEKHTELISSKERDYKLSLSVQSEAQKRLIKKHELEIENLKQNITRLTSENIELKNKENDSLKELNKVLEQQNEIKTAFRELTSNLEDLQAKKETVEKSKKGDGKKKHKKYKRKSGKRRNKKM